MNQVKLSGQITEGPRFQTLGVAFTVSTFVLYAGQKDTGQRNFIRIIAKGPAAEQLRAFADGDWVKVSGRLCWQADGIEIWADDFKQHREGRYRAEKEWRSRILPKVKGF